MTLGNGDLLALMTVIASLGETISGLRTELREEKDMRGRETTDRMRLEYENARMFRELNEARSALSVLEADNSRLNAVLVKLQEEQNA